MVTAKFACFKKDEDCYLDVTVYPLPEDFDNAEGLCGNFNGEKDDDQVPKGSTVNEDKKEPIKFATSYMSVLFCVISHSRRRSTSRLSRPNQVVCPSVRPHIVRSIPIKVGS